MNLITVFRASSGLNVKVDPSRIFFDPEIGVADLAVAYNVDHDSTGRISRRKGFTVKNLSYFRDIFYGGSDIIGVTGTSLCVFSKDMTSYRVIDTITDNSRLSCAQIGQDIYWVNGYEKGCVKNGENNEWVKTDYYGPETKRTLSGPPVGNFVIAYSGVLYIAVGSAIYHSDLYSLNHFDLFRNNFPVEANITMIDWVPGGIYVGTEMGVWFLAGANPKSFQLTKVNDSRVIRGTAVKVNLDTTGFKQVTQEGSGIGLMWTATDGIYIGTPTGRAHNLTHKKLFKIEATEGAAQVINGRYVVNLAD